MNRNNECVFASTASPTVARRVLTAAMSVNDSHKLLTRSRFGNPLFAPDSSANSRGPFALLALGIRKCSFLGYSQTGALPNNSILRTDSEKAQKIAWCCGVDSQLSALCRSLAISMQLLIYGNGGDACN